MAYTHRHIAIAWSHRKIIVHFKYYAKLKHFDRTLKDDNYVEIFSSYNIVVCAHVLHIQVTPITMVHFLDLERFVYY